MHMTHAHAKICREANFFAEVARLAEQSLRNTLGFKNG